MKEPRDNLTSKRYKTCGWGGPVYDQNGHYDEVGCGLIDEYGCGEGVCPLDLPEPDYEPDYDPDDPDKERDLKEA